MTFENWLAFCAIALLATATPGPAALLVSVHSVSWGFRKSLATILGNVTGLFVMSGFSVLGLSTLVLHSAWAFTLVKIIGALYLAYMGVMLWKNGVVNIKPEKAHSRQSRKSLYLQGVLVALTNPKAIVFTTALFPQFIDISQALIPQFSLLVGSFMMLSFICLSSYALLAQKAKSLTIKQVSNQLLGKILGSTFVGAGCYLASTSR